MNWLTIILGFTATVTVVGLLAILTWLLYTGHLARVERRLAERKGIYREVVSGLATRERALLEPEIHQLRTLHDFEALEAVLEEQARSSTERPAWLLDAYDRLGLVENYVTRLRKAEKWRERAFAAELLGRVGNAKAVPALLETIQATRTEDADVREIALRALARIKDPRAVAPLVEALRKAEVWLAPRIADILGRHGEVVVDPMIGFLTETTRHPARAWAANILGELRAPRAFPVLVQALGDLDDEVRAKAAGALGRLGDRRAITYLLDTLLTDPAPFVRARIAGALGQFNEPEVIERLVRALGDPAWWVRMRSVEALEQIGPVAESPLLLALDDPDPEIRIRAAVALERLGVPARLISRIESGDLGQDALGTLTKFAVAGAREMLAEHLHHPSAGVRGAVIDAVRVAQRRDLAAELIECARQDPETAVRASALEALHSLGIPESVPAALDCLSDADPKVRAQAMSLLGDLGGQDLADVIRPRSSDPQPLVRAAAARALGLVRARDATEEFTRLLRDPEPHVRAAAADGVAGANARVAAPVLTDLLGDTDPEVRLAVARALGALGDAAAVQPMLRTFRDADPTLRLTLIQSIARLDPAALEELIDLLLEAQDAPARVGVVETIGHLKSERSFHLLERLWRDEAPAVRVAVANVLSKFDGERVAPLLAQGLSDPEALVRARAIDGLIRLGRNNLGGEIVKLLANDPSPLVRERAALATGIFRHTGAETAVLNACRADQPLNVRAAAALAIGAYDQESMVTRVLEMADEADLRDMIRERLKEDSEYRLLGLRLREARHVELRALASTSREQMEATLAEGMRGVLSAEQRVRLVAGLKAFQGERSRSALLQVIRGDPSPEVRASALTAVGGMLEEEELFLTASRALADPHRDVRHAAIALFQRIGPEKALPALVRQLKGDDDPVTLQAVADRAEADFDAFVDLALGVALDGQEAIMVARVARFMHHPGLARVLGVIARSETADVRDAVARAWAGRPDMIDQAALEGMTADPTVSVRRGAVQAWRGARRWDRLALMITDPDPGIRQDVALAFLDAPDVTPLAALEQDPDEMVRAMLFAVRLLHGDTGDVGGLSVSRPAAATAIRRARPTDWLRETARGALEGKERAPAALALAVLDDEVAYHVMRADPLRTIRDQVSRMLASWRESPDARRQA
ncbi:MAG TPA: HEAT repeat domain-containing protein [Gemmatimonadales bacterium]|nr:HEAT repeat domain-containing protein [Gemmatimonadales bacterium]